ncbi:MAG: hypothetical protein HFG08_09875 [Oscillibacter sp.]|jgi:hypothetical protein|nr:hypothetical protein [Oscillibacter sp.]
MQDSKVMASMLKDLTQYILIPNIRYAREIGIYASCDIAAYDSFYRDIVAIVPDATPDRNLAPRMTSKFNRYQLSPCHLYDAVLGMLKQALHTAGRLCTGRELAVPVRC